jgi:signal transduction histidine kinase
MNPVRRVTAFDLGLAGCFVLAGQVELALHRDLHNPRWWDTAALTLLLAALTWRRRTPLLVCVAGVVLVTALSWRGDIQSLNVPMVVLFVPPYSVARYEDRRSALLGLGLALLVPLAVDVRTPDTGGLVFDVAMVVSSWAAGRALRGAADRAAALRGRSVRAQQGREELERLAAASERARIARDLQRVVVGSVSDMVVQAETAARLIGTSAVQADACMESVEQTAQWVLADMRRMLGLLRSGDHSPGLVPLPGLDDLGGLGGVTGRRTRVEYVGTPRDLPTSVGLALYRVIEAADDERPGRAEVLGVTVRYLPDAIEVELAPGGGLPTAWPTPHMREWAGLCEGELRRRTTSDGAVLTVRVPENVGAYT